MNSSWCKAIAAASVSMLLLTAFGCSATSSPSSSSTTSSPSAETTPATASMQEKETQPEPTQEKTAEPEPVQEEPAQAEPELVQAQPESVQKEVAQSDPAPQQDANVYYKNCAAVRAAGKAPLYQGDPGYSSKLDRDGDGIACE